MLKTVTIEQLFLYLIHARKLRVLRRCRTTLYRQEIIVTQSNTVSYAVLLQFLIQPYYLAQTVRYQKSIIVLQHLFDNWPLKLIITN